MTDERAYENYTAFCAMVNVPASSFDEWQKNERMVSPVSLQEYGEQKALRQRRRGANE